MKLGHMVAPCALIRSNSGFCTAGEAWLQLNRRKVPKAAVFGLVVICPRLLPRASEVAGTL